MEIKDFERYCAYSQEVQGWFGAEALFAGLNEIQSLNGIKGNLFEIGVHHGKSSILMKLFARENEYFACCDLFENQKENKSHSGKGNKDIFYNHMKIFFGETSMNFKTFDCKSSSLSKKIIGEDYRFFHIDGGHSLDETLSDLNLANESLKYSGLALIDDCFNYRFPEVSEAIAKSILNKEINLIPLAIGKNKLILSRKEFQKFYFENLLSKNNNYLNILEEREERKIGRFFGQKIVIFFGQNKKDKVMN